MLPLRPLSLSALLLAASACVSAAEPGAEALAAPQAPALQVTPAVEVPAAPAVAPAEARSAPLVPGLPGLPAGAALGALLDPQTLALLDQLSALQVTPQQALGGVGALLGLAQSQLAADQYAQLAGSVPGLELLGGSAGQAAEASDGAGGVLGRLGALGGLLGASPAPAAPPQAPLDSRAGVDQAFALLGMDSSLVGPFGQILLQFLAGQGLAGTLLQSLGGIWGVPAAPMLGTPVASGSGI